MDIQAILAGWRLKWYHTTISFYPPNLYVRYWACTPCSWFHRLHWARLRIHFRSVTNSVCEWLLLKVGVSWFKRHLGLKWSVCWCKDVNLLCMVLTMLLFSLVRPDQMRCCMDLRVPISVGVAMNKNQKLVTGFLQIGWWLLKLQEETRKRKVWISWMWNLLMPCILVQVTIL